MTARLQIAIVGYGIAGISAAVHLRRQGHVIAHFDRHDPPSALGAGMLLHPPAKRELESLGILEQAQACGAPVDGIDAWTTRGTPLFALGYPELAAGHAGLGIQRGTLHRLLSGADAGRDAVIAGRNMTRVDPHGGYLIEESGVRHGPYDLIVVADGTESELRRAGGFTTVRNARADTAALVGLVDEPRDFATDRLVQRFDGGAHVSVWPVGSGAPGDPPKLSFAMNLRIGGANAFRDGGEWRRVLSRFFPELGPGVEGEGSVTFRPYVFTYRDVEVGAYSNGRVVLVGDAAHSMSPQLGVGAQLAMADARILASHLAASTSVPAALGEYSRTRPMQLRRYQRASRWLTPFFQSDGRLIAGLRDRVLAAAMRSPVAQRVAQELLS